jgi:hypothetical protein
MPGVRRFDMGGILFRLGVRLKDKGEQLKRGWLIRLGLKIMERAMKHGKI